jgi:hypothetical protein
VKLKELGGKPKSRLEVQLASCERTKFDAVQDKGN